MRCALPPVCPCCSGKRFVYVPKWRHGFPRTSIPEDPSEAFTSEMAAGEWRFVVATTRPESVSFLGQGSQVNLPISLRLCATCGAVQPYVDPAGIRALVEGAGDQAVYVDHDAEPGQPYR